MCRETLFFSQTILQISLLRRLHGPCGAGRGLRPRSRACGATPFPRGLYKPITYNSSKTFFILFLTSNKTVSKIKPAEKNNIFFQINGVKPFVHWPPSGRPGAPPRPFSAGFCCKPFIQTNKKLVPMWG